MSARIRELLDILVERLASVAAASPERRGDSEPGGVRPRISRGASYDQLPTATRAGLAEHSRARHEPSRLRVRSMRSVHRPGRWGSSRLSELAFDEVARGEVTTGKMTRGIAQLSRRNDGRMEVEGVPTTGARGTR